MTSCDDIQDEVLLLAFGELGDELRALVEQHVRSCAECRAILATAGWVRSQAEADGDVLPMEIRQAALWRMSRHARMRRRRRRVAALATAAGVAIAAVGLGWYHYGRPAPGPSRPTIVITESDREVLKEALRQAREQVAWFDVLEGELSSLKYELRRTSRYAQGEGIVRWELRGLSDRLDRLTAESEWSDGLEASPTSRPQSYRRETSDGSSESAVIADAGLGVSGWAII